jgi:hypothetical protein
METGSELLWSCPKNSKRGGPVPGKWRNIRVSILGKPLTGKPVENVNESLFRYHEFFIFVKNNYTINSASGLLKKYFFPGHVK